MIEQADNSIDKTLMVQKMAEQTCAERSRSKGHKVLLLPVYHPELNLIETVWAIVKLVRSEAEVNECGKLLRQSIQFKEVRQYLGTAFNHITPETCQGLYNKIQAKENQYWLADVELDSIDEDVF